MNLHNLPINRILIAFMAVAMAACSSSKKAGVAGVGTVDSSAAASASRNSGVKAKDVPLVSELGATYSDWTDLYAPVSLKATQPTSFSISGRATMVRDEAVYLSLRMLGIEVATVYVNSDSAWVADKYHKNLCAVSLSSVTNKTSLTVGNLQDLLLGQAFYPGKGTISNSGSAYMFSPTESIDNITMLTPRRLPDGANWYYSVDNNGPQLTELTVSADSIGSFTVSFSDIVNSVAGNVASRVETTGAVGELKCAATIVWDMNKAQWNTGRQIPESSYKGYKRMTLKQFLSSLKSF